MILPMKYWILKTEPSAYSCQDLERDQTTTWTGVRNFQARNNLRAMKVGDLCFLYHSGKEKQIMAIAEVVKTAYPDPTSPGEDWVCVDIKMKTKLKHPVSLSLIKEQRELEKMALVKQGRLSVSPVTKAEYERIHSLNTLS